MTAPVTAPDKDPAKFTARSKSSGCRGVRNCSSSINPPKEKLAKNASKKISSLDLCSKEINVRKLSTK